MGSNKKRILIFTDWFLPGYKAGGPIRSLANLIRHLNHELEIFLACGDRDYLDDRPYDKVELNTWIDVYGIKLIYLPPSNQQINTYSSIIDRLNPDVVYINGIFSKSFSINPLIALKGSKRRVIVAPRGMLAKGAMSIKAFKKKAFLNFAKVSRLYENVHFHATSKQEKIDISRRFPRNNITFIPNLPTSAPNKKHDRKEKKPGEIRLISVARIAPEKNIDFALDTLKELDDSLNVEMTFIGSVYDQKYMQKCVSKSNILPDSFELSFTGSKSPEEIKSYYKRAHLFFLPTRGENYGHAIVEALDHNLPVLISDKTPWSNLKEDRLGADYPLDNLSDFGEFIESVARMDEAEYNSYTEGLAQRFSKRVDLKGNISSYKELFNAKG